ncbi:MAG: hypothetical protein F6K48_03045 [Okeania sp. SIO3H1]|nr:hypothetical protein [Okeania sp. SIO3H1]
MFLYRYELKLSPRKKYNAFAFAKSMENAKKRGPKMVREWQAMELVSLRRATATELKSIKDGWHPDTKRNPSTASEKKAASLLDKHGIEGVKKKIATIGDKIRSRQDRLGMNKKGPLAMLQEGLAHATDKEREDLYLLKLALGMHEKVDRAGAHSRIMARRKAKKAKKHNWAIYTRKDGLFVDEVVASSAEEALDKNRNMHDTMPMAIKRGTYAVRLNPPKKKTLSKVKTKHSTPAGLFTKTADKIVKGLLKDAKGDHALAIKRITFYINRAGKDLSNRRSVMAAQKKLSEMAIKKNPGGYDIVSWKTSKRSDGKFKWEVYGFERKTAAITHTIATGVETSRAKAATKAKAKVRQLKATKKNPIGKRLTNGQQATAYMDKVLKHLMNKPYAELTVRLEGIVPADLDPKLKAQVVRMLMKNDIITRGDGVDKNGLSKYRTTHIFRSSLKSHNARKRK